MDKHLLEYIEIKDFKCFKDFKAEGFKRVNLIGGKNNVGKTAFMEACYVNLHSKTVSSLIDSLAKIRTSRYTLDILENKNNGISHDTKELIEVANGISISSKLNKVNYRIFESNGKKEYWIDIAEKSMRININQFSFEQSYFKDIRYIDNLGMNKSDLKEVYISVQKKDKEELLDKYINEFDYNVSKFKILGGDEAACKVLDRDIYQNINAFGDGLKHYISIICSLYACENGYLFIDEIENGIHYTQLDRLWEIILTISKEQNVQVFATTHSKECIDAFNRVQLKLEDKETTYLELAKNTKTKELFMSSIDKEQLDYELTHDGRVRGE